MASPDVQIALFDASQYQDTEKLQRPDLPPHIKFLENPVFIQNEAEARHITEIEATQRCLSHFLYGKVDPYIVVAYHFGGITEIQDGTPESSWILFGTEAADDAINSARELSEHPYIVLPEIMDSFNMRGFDETYDGTNVAYYVPYQTASLQPIGFRE